MRGPESIRSFTVFTHVDGSRDRGRVVRAFVCVCVSVCVCVCFRTICQKPKQLGSPNVTQKCFKMSPGSWKPIYFGSKGQGHGSKILLVWVLHSCECWLLLVVLCQRVHFDQSINIYSCRTLTEDGADGVRLARQLGSRCS